MNIVVWNLTQLEAAGVNTGDKAIIASIANGLKKAIPDVKITLISGNPEYVQRSYNINSVKAIQIFRAINKADLFLVGGGEIVGDSSCLLYSPSILSGPLFAGVVGKPISCYSVGIADYREISSMSRLLTKLALNRAKLITVRDVESKSALDEIGVTNPPVYVTADPAFALNSSSPIRGQEILAAEGVPLDSPIVGIMPRRVFPSSFSVLPVNLRLKLNLTSLTLSNRLRKAIAQSADYLVEKMAATIVFFPMYVGTTFGYGDDDFSREIIESMRYKNRAKIITGDYAAEDILSIFRHLELVIGTPLHSMILAATAGVPIVNISYSQKTERIVRVLGQQHVSIRAEAVTTETLMSKILLAWDNKENIQRIRREVKSLREKALLNVGLTCKLVDQLN